MKYVFMVALLMTSMLTMAAAVYCGENDAPEIKVHKFDNLAIHTFASKEAFGDWTIIFETDDALVMLEPQSMPKSAIALREYIAALGKPLAGIIVSYHGVGPESYPGVPIYASKAAIDFIKSNQVADVMGNYKTLFPEFDDKVIMPTRTLEKNMTIGGIDFEFFFDDHAYPMPGVDVAIPSSKIYYMHMLAGDSHSIIGDLSEIDPFIAYLRNVMALGYETFLCSHHGPETVADIKAKIDYLLLLKNVAGKAKSADEFVNAMKKAAPDKKGEQYLGMTAANLFK